MSAMEDGGGELTREAPTAPEDPARVTRALLLAAAGVFGLAALVYNEWTLGLLSTEEFTTLTLGRIRSSQALFALAGVLLALASEAARRVPALRALAARGLVQLALLSLLGLLVPLLLLDLGLRPFVDPKTNLFVRDPDLGWRPRPGARGEWGHVQVAINAKGLRGPEVAWEKPPDVLRILYLGDSVTFGFGLERVEDTYPYLVGAELEDRLGTRVETVNSGVGGWSPWQQHRYLLRDGLRFDPDLIVVGFVLNDVTEKFSLRIFGGADDGWQLARTTQSRLDAWLSHSALVSFLREGIAYFRFGSNVFIGAQRYEAMDVRFLAARPRDPRLRRAWSITLGNLQKIFGVATEHRIPAAIVVFPFAFQLADPVAMGGPQAVLREFAAARGIPMLDLLPVFTASARDDDGDPAGAGDLFIDAGHLSAQGGRVSAAAIAEFLISRELVPAPRATAGAGTR